MGGVVETQADKVRAFVYAVVVHLVTFALMFVGLWWTRPPEPVSVAGPAIEAVLITDPNAALQRALEELPAQPKPKPPKPQPEPEEEAAPPPQPRPEPSPQDAQEEQQRTPQEQVPEPDVQEQDEVSAQALADEQAREKEQEEKRRQEQIELTEEIEKQKQAEERQRLSRMQEERLKQLADIRRQRAEAETERKREEERMRELDDAQRRKAEALAQATPPPGNEGVNQDLSSQYGLAIAEAIRRNWTRPETVPLGAECRIHIVQIPGGEVISAEVDPSCPYDALGRRSVEAAVLKAAPLPYAGFESVFSRELNLRFRAEDQR